jgi:hypothetical protein
VLQVIDLSRPLLVPGDDEADAELGSSLKILTRIDGQAPRGEVFGAAHSPGGEDS